MSAVGALFMLALIGGDIDFQSLLMFGTLLACGVICLMFAEQKEKASVIIWSGFLTPVLTILYTLLPSAEVEEILPELPEAAEVSEAAEIASNGGIGIFALVMLAVFFLMPIIAAIGGLRMKFEP